MRAAFFVSLREPPVRYAALAPALEFAVSLRHTTLMGSARNDSFRVRSRGHHGGRSRAVSRVLRILLFALLPVFTWSSTPALAQPDFFFFLRPPAPVPQGGQRQNRNTGGWWPGFGPPTQQRGPQPDVPAPAPPKKVQPVEPEGTVYASADAAIAGKKQPPTQFALVLGDRMGGQLAQGLADAYVPDRSRLAIVEYTQDDSGYLPAPLDWMTKAPWAIGNGRPNVTIVALGAEDLKPIKEGELVLEPLTDRWIEVYSRRVDEVLALLREKGGRVIVVGVAPVANASVSADYERLNEILRARAARAGLPFVSVWDGFVDEENKFLVTGPAVDGQKRRLRTNDGLRFTRAGGRKLAFFVQKDLNRLLEDPAKPSAGSEAIAPALSLAGAPPRLDPRPASGTSAPSQATPVAAPGAGASAALGSTRALKDGVLPPPARGRADDFSWPPPSSALPPETPAVQR